METWVFEKIERLKDQLYLRENQISELQKTINEIHMELSIVLNDATDGKNWKTLIDNIKQDIKQKDEIISNIPVAVGEAVDSFTKTLMLRVMGLSQKDVEDYKKEKL